MKCGVDVILVDRYNVMDKENCVLLIVIFWNRLLIGHEITFKTF